MDRAAEHPPQDSPIAEADRARLRREAHAELSKRRAGARGRIAFVPHGLAETLPAPTPLSWDFWREFLSPRGALGWAYRLLTLDPCAAADRPDPAFLLLGRVVLDLDRAPEVFFGPGPLAYDLERIRRRPEAAIEPPDRLDFARADPFRSISVLWRARRAAPRLRRLLEDEVARRLDGAIALMDAWIRKPASRSLDGLDARDLLARFESAAGWVFGGFGPEWLLAALAANDASGRLEEALERSLGKTEGRRFALEMSAALPENPARQMADALGDAAAGWLSRETFLSRFSHRGPGEMDLAGRTYGDDPAALEATIAAVRSAERGPRKALPAADGSALDRTLEERLASAGNGSALGAIRPLLARTRFALAARERAKDAFLRGLAIVRSAARALGQRLGIGDAVFFLERSELSQTARGTAPPEAAKRLAESRRRDRDLALAIPLPHFLDGRDIDRILGGPEPSASAAEPGGALRGTAAAPGIARGPAHLVAPGAPPPPPGSVLVAAVPDPSLSQFLPGAAALVSEQGGILSHAAILARELGIPCVILPGARARIREGDVVRVDGNHGLVLPPGASERPAPFDPGPEPWIEPPPAGALRRALAWLVFSLAAAVALLQLPGIVRSAVFAADVLLYPVVRNADPFGAAVSAAVLGALLATLLLLPQSSPARARRIRARWAWLSRSIRAARKAGAPDDATDLRKRRDDAAAERLPGILRTAAISLPGFLVAFLWVQERLAWEPIRPGRPFEIVVEVRPDRDPEGAAGIRFARLDAPSEIDGERFVALANARGGAREARFRLVARAPGTHSLRFRVRGSEATLPVLATYGRARLDPETVLPGPISAVRLVLEPARADWPAPIGPALDATVRLFSGRGADAHPASLPPMALYLLAAVALASVARRLLGFA
ncbi:MAG: PEP-utilizing enzyme [Planctomycetota bacterium]